MKFNKTLWTIQGGLAGLFLFAGAMKLILPIEAMTAQVALPGPFLRFLGVVEILGAAGLILPWLLKIRPVLTPVAAAGLVVIMTGATAIMTATAGIGQALMPLIVGVLAASVALGRSRQLGIASRKPRLARLDGRAHSGVPAVS
jgi:hypothetical protein